MSMDALIEKAMRTPYSLSHDEVISLLETENTDELFSAAYQLKCRYIGKTVSMRGIIEMGNVCAKDCYYCGIRRGNPNVKRYQLSEDDVVRMAELEELLDSTGFSFDYNNWKKQADSNR